MVELVVIVVIICILAVVSIVGWSSWNRSVLESEFQAELNSIVAAMDQERNFKNSYPTSLPASYRPGRNFKVTYVYGNANTYCIEVESVQDRFAIKRVNTGVVGTGAC